ncbi:protoporphyrinogen oxidase [Kwoniella pini CBS 10737]|uniref:Protoporphyrinogen oxidase n=1 Tax=Kwoniella pini CBS 10737 TaxID=1296096 RepID=A0A1B9I1A7_9TREE|nr:protoporphyrinogen oxidase [Kwoniella pini CBS 10737]OCF49323.1 protoporphyrinogen oxidase [Kwoniella pini CBS 10737]
MSFPKRITILGGGLSGLTTAYKLSQLPQASNSKITLIEGSNRIGGWINSTKHHVEFINEKGELIKGDVTLESGPRSLRPRGSKGAIGMLKLIKDLDLSNDIIPIPFSHPAAKNRFLLDISNSNSKLISLPNSLFSLLFNNSNSNLLKGLISSIIKEPFKSKISNEIKDESVNSFFERRFSKNLAQNLASSMVHGIYATSSDELSVRSSFPILWEKEKKFGSVILGMLFSSNKKSNEELNEIKELGKDLNENIKNWSLYGIKGGLSNLINKMNESIKEKGIVEIKLNQMINSIKINKNKNNLIEIDILNNEKKLETDYIISSISPLNLSNLLIEEKQEENLKLSNLNSNSYTTVGVVNLVYPILSKNLHPEGFGYLIPRPPLNNTKKLNKFGILGCIFDSTAIPFKEDLKNVTKLTLMLGGPYWNSNNNNNKKDFYKPKLEIPKNEEELINNSINHLENVFPILKEKNLKPILKIGKINYNCIPTYKVGHGFRMKELHHEIKQSNWNNKLSLIGNGYGGVGLNDCIYSVQHVIDSLNKGEIVTGLERWENWE